MSGKIWAQKSYRILTKVKKEKKQGDVAKFLPVLVGKNLRGFFTNPASAFWSQGQNLGEQKAVR